MQPANNKRQESDTSVQYATLVRLLSTHDNLRTSEVYGIITELPIIGREFCILSKPIDPRCDIRRVLTTPVQSVHTREDGTIEFRTMNTTYWLVLGKYPDGDTNGHTN